AEVAQLDHLRHPAVELRQLVESLVDVKDLLGARGDSVGHLEGEAYVGRAAPAPDGPALASEVDDDRAHHAPGVPHEMHAVLELQALVAREAKVGLVDERARVSERVAAARAK